MTSDDGEDESALDRTETILVPDDAVGMRLDTWLARRQDMHSRTFFQQLLKDGHVLLDGRVAKGSVVLGGGESVVVTLPPVEDPWPHPQDLPISVLYEDAEIIVVNKAAGMVVHPAAGNPDGTLVNALLHHCRDLPGINGVKRPGLVHRLDRETSGVIVVAKTERAMTTLSRAIHDRRVSRLYVALVIGEADWMTQTVNIPIGRHETIRVKRAAHGVGAKEAVTHLRVLGRAFGFTLLECKLETGRTHQIRVHCQHLGMPIAGDAMYGGTDLRALEKLRHAPSSIRSLFQRLARPFLHARVLRFRHPETQTPCEFRAPLPEDLLLVANELFGPGQAAAMVASIGAQEVGSGFDA